jgi:hypothetical protein
VKEEESLACSLVPLVQVVNERQLGQLDVVPADREIKLQVLPVFRIRIRIGGFNQASESVSGSGYKRPTKEKKIKKFHVLKCWRLSFEG